jgi:hypothetical protein
MIVTPHSTRAAEAHSQSPTRSSKSGSAQLPLRVPARDRVEEVSK